MRIVDPAFIANEEILWLREDGTELLIQAFIGTPYNSERAWACPAALMGVDGRYPDIVGESSLQSLSLALRLIRQRLGHLLDTGAVLVHQHDKNVRWDLTAIDAVFGIF